MSQAKIEIKIGAIEFEAEGDQVWVAQQLDKVFEKAAGLALLAPAPVTPAAMVNSSNPSDAAHTPMGSDPLIAAKPLAVFLKERNANTKQVDKFLATAIWLESKGKARLTTTDVTNALKSSNQSRLGNPADCLNQNVSKGRCEKDGKEFFVTQEGKKAIGS
jgi:hypothetical protein